MFFILSKALLFLISPFFWLMTCLAIALFHSNANYQKRAKIASVLLFLFFSNTFIFNEFCRKWEIHGTPVEEVGSYEVGIVLSGMAEYNYDLKSLSIKQSGDRIWQAITLYKQHKIKKILITGKSGYITDRGLDEAKQFKEVLVSWGIPANDIITETISKNTHENALETKKVLNTSYPHVDTCLLITSATHMRRSLGCFAKQEINCIPFSTNLHTGPKRSFYWDQVLIPNVDNFSAWNELIKEWFGYVTYKIAGYL